MLRALRVVPWAAQAKVALLLLLTLLLLLLPWLVWSAHWLLLFVAELAVSGALLYLLWCRVPVGMLLVPHDLRGELPQPFGQGLLLSFDDGPTYGLTDRVLDLLRESGLRASFFVLLHKAERSPHLIRRIVAEGHLLGLHGEDHRLPLGRSRAELVQSLRRGRERLAILAGQPVQLFRPSHGVRTLALFDALRQAGLSLCLWDHGIWDTDAPPPSTLLARMQLVRSLGLRKGRPRVLLLHDGRGDEPGLPPHATSLLAALTDFLPSLRAAGRAGLPTGREQLLLRPMDQPDLAHVGHDVAQVGDLGATRQPR